MHLRGQNAFIDQRKYIIIMEYFFFKKVHFHCILLHMNVQMCAWFLGRLNQKYMCYSWIHDTN